MEDEIKPRLEGIARRLQALRNVTIERGGDVRLPGLSIYIPDIVDKVIFIPVHQALWLYFFDVNIVDIT